MTTTKFVFSSLMAASLVASTVAFASEPQNTVGCLDMSHHVTQALSDSQQSENYKAARDEQSTARQFCQSGVYDKGIAHYSRALELLGKDNNQVSQP